MKLLNIVKEEMNKFFKKISITFKKKKKKL